MCVCVFSHMLFSSSHSSGFPSKKNFPFLLHLGIRSVLFLCPEEYPALNLSFLSKHHAKLLQFGVAGNKEPFIEIPIHTIREALKQVIDPKNHPILIHCNKGKVSHL
jgi:tyrosine-protein phosphatase SIW14